MKWIGQNIYDFVATFRQGVTMDSTLTFDSVSLSAVQTSAESFADNDTSLMTSAAIDDRINTAVTAEDLDVAGDSGTAAVDLNSQSLTVTGGTNVTTSATGQAVTINVDDAFIKNNAADTMAVSDFGANAALFINADQPATAGAEDSKGLYIDYDRIVAGSGTAAHNDIGIDLDVNSATLGTGTVTGMDIDVVGATSGTHTAVGIDLDVDSADTNIGMQINTAGTHMKLVANADADDYATIAVANTGDLTITTVGDGATDSDLTFTVDGNVAVNAGTTSVNSTSITRRKFGLSGGTEGMGIGTIYHYKSDGTCEVTNANAVATCDGLLGVALGAASDTNGMLLRGMVTLDHDPGAVGDVLFLSAASNGDATSTAPSGSSDIVRVIGYQVNHASQGEIWFNPDNTYVEVA